MRADTVEQVFVRRRGGHTEVLLVLESPAGERLRETLPLGGVGFEEAARRAAVELARRGIRPARRLRVRSERGGSLDDDAALRDVFLRAWGDDEDDARWD